MTQTPTVSVGRALDLALRMADEADALALEGHRGDVGIEMKPDATPVTRVDREIEAAVRDLIDNEHSVAGVLGEEYGEKPGVGRWVIDPIDGTENFISGDPRFATLLAYELDGESLIGVVSAPALGLRWWAAKGEGAFYSEDGKVSHCRVSITTDLNRAIGMVVKGSRLPQRSQWLFATGLIAARPSVSWEAVRVANGEFDLAYTTGHWWDVAPLGIIVEEAGGSCVRYEENDGLVGISLTNQAIAHDVADLLA